MTEPVLYESQGQSQKTIQVNSTSTHLNSGVGLLGVEGDPDWEKVIWTSVTRELHTSGLVVRIDDRKLPKKRSPLLVAVVAVAFGHDRGS